MFCPGCGTKEERPLQYCRTCGVDLRAVREKIEQPEAGSSSALAGREEIVRALATKIKDGQWWEVGAMIPSVEKIFESPQERRLRRIRENEQQRLKRLRQGTVTASVGLGAILLALVVSYGVSDAFYAIGPGLVVLMIGLGILINGLLFTSHKQILLEPVIDQDKREIADTSKDAIGNRERFIPSSVTEHTTERLRDDLINTDPLGNS